MPARRSDKHVHDVLGDERVLDAVSTLRGIAQAQIQVVDDLVASYLRRPRRSGTGTGGELLERVRARLAAVIDLRSPEKYAQGHVVGTLNVLLERLQEHLGALPADREPVSYCRGPWCILSCEAVATPAANRPRRPPGPGRAPGGADGGSAGGRRPFGLSEEGPSRAGNVARIPCSPRHTCGASA